MSLPPHPQSTVAAHSAGSGYLEWLEELNKGRRKKHSQLQQQQEQQASALPAPAYDARRFEPFG